MEKGQKYDLTCLKGTYYEKNTFIRCLETDVSKVCVNNQPYNGKNPQTHFHPPPIYQKQVRGTPVIPKDRGSFIQVYLVKNGIKGHTWIKQNKYEQESRISRSILTFTMALSVLCNGRKPS